MSLLGTAAAIGLWLVVGIGVYAALSYLILFYLPGADRLSSGVVADAAFVVTLPFVVAMTWLAAVRNRR